MISSRLSSGSFLTRFIMISCVKHHGGVALGTVVRVLADLARQHARREWSPLCACSQ
jgi:hypothetical protein